MKTIEQKINVIKNLSGCGWSVQDEAHIAARAIQMENERHAQALEDIAEWFARVAWARVEKAQPPKKQEED